MPGAIARPLRAFAGRTAGRSPSSSPQTRAARCRYLPLRLCEPPNPNPAALPSRGPLTLGRRGPAACRACQALSEGRVRFALSRDPQAPRRRPWRARERRAPLPAPTPYNLITRDIKLSSRSLIVMRVTGTQHSAACFDSRDPFAGSGCVWVLGGGGCRSTFKKHCESHAG